MIAWWWLPVSLGGMWLVLLTVGAVVDEELRGVLGRVLLACACLPVLVIAAVLTRIDVGAVRLSPGTLARFARMRSADETHPAWMFWVWKQGVILVRKWDLGEKKKPTVQLNPKWREEVEQ